MSAHDSDDDVQPQAYRLGQDPDVQRALDALCQAMSSAAKTAGQELMTCAVVWGARIGDDCHSACFVVGDTSPEVIGFLAEVLMDDSDDEPMAPGGRVH